MNKTYYCLGNGERGCDGCAAEKNWQSINELPNEYRIRLQSNQNFVRVDDTECILRGRPYYKTTAPIEPVKQEPVAIMSPNKANIVGINTPYANIGTDDWIKLYAAPVRTKDLTDDEVAKAYMECTGGDIIARCRAVIAKFKEKNR